MQGQSFARALELPLDIVIPRKIGAVGQFYEHFDQTTDQEVIDVLHTMSV